MNFPVYNETVFAPFITYQNVTPIVNNQSTESTDRLANLK